MNKVILFGHLGSDPELKMTPSGQAVLKMRLATTERYKDKSGTWGDRTEWHAVVVWGKRAEGLAKFLTKGHAVLIEGNLRTSSYEDKEGKKRYKTEVVAFEVRSARGGGGRQESRQPDSFGDTGTSGAGAIDDSEIPFAPWEAP